METADAADADARVRALVDDILDQSPRRLSRRPAQSSSPTSQGRPPDRPGARQYTTRWTDIPPVSRRTRGAQTTTRGPHTQGSHSTKYLTFRRTHPIRQEEGRQASPMRGLPSPQQADHQELLSSSSHRRLAGPHTWSNNLQQDRPSFRLPPDPHRRERHPQDSIPHTLRTLRIHGASFRPDQRTCYLPTPRYFQILDTSLSSTWTTSSSSPRLWNSTWSTYAQCAASFVTQALRQRQKVRFPEEPH